MLRNSIILIIGAMLFIGCGGSRIISNNYGIQEAVKKTALIIPPVIDSVFVRNEDDIRDDFGGDLRPVNVVLRSAFSRGIAKTFSKMFPYKSGTIFSIDTVHEIAANSSFYLKELKMQHKSKKIPSCYTIPTDDWFAENSYKPDYVIAINRIEYGINLDEPMAGAGHFIPGATISVPGHGSFTTPGSFVGGNIARIQLVGLITYIIYDMKRKNFVSYGVQKVSKGYSFYLSRSDWEDTFEEAVQKMIEGTPWETANN